MKLVALGLVGDPAVLNPIAKTLTGRLVALHTTM
jgi:hypothetical protein